MANYVTKIALSHPDISFKFIRDNKTELLTAGDGKLYSGIYSVFGREFASSLIRLNIHGTESEYTDIRSSLCIQNPTESFRIFCKRKIR